MMSQIRLRQSQAGERLGRVDGRYVVEGVMQEQLKQVRKSELKCWNSYIGLI